MFAARAPQVSRVSETGLRWESLKGFRSVYMLDAPDEKLLPSKRRISCTAFGQALLDISEAIAVYQDLNELFHEGISGHAETDLWTLRRSDWAREQKIRSIAAQLARPQ
jgi:hypothetical protein